MEVELLRPDNPALTFDEVSMERRKNFVKALQELKNLRPQLYSAAEYCEKSYLHSEQKQMVLDNLKDYAVRALVNAVDHLGTVAYKLTDLLEQQTLEVSTMELKASCLNQQLLMCQTYTDKEGLRQQQLLAFIPRHHKHYILPNSVNKKVHFSPHVQTDPRQNYFQAKSRLQPSDSPASKTLSWHLSSETKSTLKGTSQTLASEISKPSGNASEVFQLLENGDNARTKSSAAPFPASNALVTTLGITHRELEGSKPLRAFRSFDNPKREVIRAPVRSKSVLSAFFVKQKATKLKAGYVA
ncbi:protein ABIL1-like isoform X2 [Durio zibethinus]|uniref:Protein ABIL1-like isoform X2 n=1 Tax=Durio zibethinus TaxID=66656 RepID=A0A6P5ZYA0_DURZI|nr:protein ABIL1-like isoform X2 [Durio zibethinus]